MGQVGSSWHKWVKPVEQVEAGLQIYVGQVGQEQGGLQIDMEQVGQEQGVCPAEPLHLTQMELSGREVFHCCSEFKVTIATIKIGLYSCYI